MMMMMMMMMMWLLLLYCYCFDLVALFPGFPPSYPLVFFLSLPLHFLLPDGCLSNDLSHELSTVSNIARLITDYQERQTFAQAGYLGLQPPVHTTEYMPTKLQVAIAKGVSQSDKCTGFILNTSTIGYFDTFVNSNNNAITKICRLHPPD